MRDPAVARLAGHGNPLAKHGSDGRFVKSEESTEGISAPSVLKPELILSSLVKRHLAKAAGLKGHRAVGRQIAKLKSDGKVGTESSDSEKEVPAPDHLHGDHEKADFRKLSPEGQERLRMLQNPANRRTM